MQGVLAGFSGYSRIVERGCAFEFTDNTQGMFAALATLRSNAQLFAQVGHPSGTFATDFANLAVSNLSADAYVHRESSVVANLKR